MQRQNSGICIGVSTETRLQRLPNRRVELAPQPEGQALVGHLAQRRLGAYWSMTRSQVYRELPALADAGYVKLGKPGARSSQPYAITPAGKRAFARWLSEAPGRMLIEI